MYTLIDDLVEVICQNEIFIEYKKQNQMLNDKDIILLLSRHQMLQEDYLRLKQYQSYVSIDDTKKQLYEIKKELSNHPQIQSYYRSYYNLNELLEEITTIVFKDISDEIQIQRYGEVL